jgi:hypothetical protein
LASFQDLAYLAFVFFQGFGIDKEIVKVCEQEDIEEFSERVVYKCWNVPGAPVSPNGTT